VGKLAVPYPVAFVMHWVDVIYFERLRRELAELDRNLDVLGDECAESEDPDGLGLLDEIESVIADGFLRCQLYMVERRGSARSRAYRCGPRHRSRYIVEIINAAANYRKHRAEWPDDVREAGWQQRDTQGVLRDAGVGETDYVLSALLHELVPGQSLVALLPLLVEWRNDFDRAVEQRV
jgi:hypothetical protein